MTNTSKNPITVVNGDLEIRLDTLAYNISTKSGVGGKMAPLRGASAVVPGRHGSIYSTGKRRDEGRCILQMWAQDQYVNGETFGDDPYAIWRSNMDTLLGMFDTSYNQIEVREYVQAVPIGESLAGKPYRRAFCEVRSAIDPEVLGRVYGKFIVELIINETFWEGSELLTFTSPTGAASNDEFELWDWATASAPIEDSILVVDGPADAPFFLDVASGHRLSLNSAIPEGQQWVIDSKNFLSSVGSGLEFDATGGTNVTAETASRGPFAPRLFGMAPRTPPKIQFGCNGADVTTGFRLRGRVKFH